MRRRRDNERRFSTNRRSSQRRAVESLDNLWKSVHEEMRNRMKSRDRRNDDNDSLDGEETTVPRTPEKNLNLLTEPISASSPLADKRVLMLESRVLDEMEKNRRIRADCIQRESEIVKELERARKNAAEELETARKVYEDRLRIESIRAEKKKETELRVAEERRKSELALLRHELTEQMNRAIQETRQNMIMRTLLRRRMSNTPESELLPERGTSSSPRGNSQQFTKFERDTLKTWEQVVRRMLRSTITNNRSLYGAHIGSHEDGDFHEAFRAFDRDGNGRISLSELADAFRRLDLGLSEKQISIILKHSDTDEDGTISYDEFVNLVDPTRTLTPSLTATSSSTTSKSKTLEELAEGSPVVVKRKWKKEFGNPTEEEFKTYDFGTDNSSSSYENNIARNSLLGNNNLDNEEEHEETDAEILVPDEDNLKYVAQNESSKNSFSSTIGSDPYGIEKQKNTENSLKMKIHHLKQERERLRRTLSFEDTDKQNSSLFSVAKTVKLHDDDKVKDETYDPYRSAWWEQVNQELNDEFETVNKECESLRQQISQRNRTGSSRRKKSGKKSQSSSSKSSSRRLNMNKCVFGDNKTLNDEKVWRANLRSPYRKNLHFSSDSLHNDRISHIHVSRRGSVQVELKNEEEEDLPPIPTVSFNDDEDEEEDEEDSASFVPRPAGSVPAWISKLSRKGTRRKNAR